MQNPIIRGLLAFVVTYWTIGLLAPGPWFSAFLAALLLISGLILLLSYAPDAFAVIKDGKLGDDRLALLGLFLLASGSVYQGLFTLTWTYAGNPTSWLGTAFSGFGRSLMIAGFGLLTVSPDTTRDGIRLPRWPVVLATVGAVAAFSFLLGMHWRGAPADPLDIMHSRAAAMQCDVDAPIKGNITDDGRRLYHIPHGLHYTQTMPERCFASELAAIGAGYRPAP